jgi:hypothetical protein
MDDEKAQKCKTKKNFDDGSRSTCRKDESKNYRNLHGIGTPKFSQKDRNWHRVEQRAKINHMRRRQPEEFGTADIQTAAR